MVMILQRYNINFEFITGKNNVVADALSRAPTDSKTNDDYIKISTIHKTSETKFCKALEKINLVNQVSISDERLKEITLFTVQIISS